MMIGIFLFLLVPHVVSFEFVFPGIIIPMETITQVRRAHRYVEEKLQLYDRDEVSKYTLYLAVENYEENLFELRKQLLRGIQNYIFGSRNLVLGKGNVIIGSNNRLAGYNNWILTNRQITSKKIETNVLYFGKWRILLDKIPYIEYRPEIAIQSMDSEDALILKNMKGLNDLKKIHNRKSNLRQSNDPS